MSVNFSLEGKVALVTGASYGIGFAIATAYAEAGATIVFNMNKRKSIARSIHVGSCSKRERPDGRWFASLPPSGLSLLFSLQKAPGHPKRRAEGFVCYSVRDKLEITAAAFRCKQGYRRLRKGYVRLRNQKLRKPGIRLVPEDLLHYPSELPVS